MLGGRRKKDYDAEAAAHALEAQAATIGDAGTATPRAEDPIPEADEVAA